MRTRTSISRSSCRALFWVLLAPAIACWSGCSGRSDGAGGVATVIHGSGNVVEESRPVSGFTRLTYASEGSVHVEVGAVESLRIRADDNLLRYLTTFVRGDTLHLRTGNNVDLRPTQNIEWFLTVTSLERIDVRGIGGMEVSDLTANRLVVTCSGIGDVLLSNLSAKELQVELGGFAGMRASGTVDRQVVTLAASAFRAYEAEGLQSREAHVRVHGSTDATVRVSDLLVVTLTGSGSVYYLGSPTVDATITGSGRVVPIGPSLPPGDLVFGNQPVVPLVIWVPRWDRRIP